MTNRKKRHFSHPDTLHRKKAILGVAVSQKMIAAAQASYDGSAEYGLGDGDMKKAIEAALKVAAEESK